MFKPLFAAAATVLVSFGASAQDVIKIGEINSYKAQPAFLEPYKKGWELAVEEVNAAGGVLGKKLQVTRCASPRNWCRARAWR
jgi:branched-chain amino acid transport system substrate-binding protein